jgi:hypothetical protein
MFWTLETCIWFIRREAKERKRVRKKEKERREKRKQESAPINTKI